MEKKLKTKATEKLFGNKKTVIKEEIKTGKQYVYEITNEGKHYILKGFKIDVVNLEPKNPSSIKRYLEMVETIKEICQEYEFARFACTFTDHFAKPLILDYELVIPENNFSYSFLYIEIVFEYGGVSLEKLKGADVNLVYNLMRQSANAFSLLHSTGIAHLDIKPGNMVYDNKEDLLKVIDMGSSFGYDTIRKTYSSTINIDNKIRSYTPIYSPPEVLQSAGTSLQNPNFILGSIDTYSWAMSFYSILFNKEEDILELEINKFKIDGERTYVEFISLLKNALGSIKFQKSEEQKKMKIIEYELLEGLNYRPEKRPTMDKMVDCMKKFENEESVNIPYKNIELKNIQRIKKIFKLGEEDNTTKLVEAVNQKSGEIKAERKELKPSKEGKEMDLEWHLCENEIKEIDEYEYSCACGLRAHELCIDNRLSNKNCPQCNRTLTLRKVPPSEKKQIQKTWVLPCCKEEVQDKEIYINTLIELNRKKMTSNVKRVICPFCSRTLDRADMKKILTTSEINSIVKALSTIESKAIKEETKTEVCSKCSAELTKEKESISFECGHKYHIICAKAILEDLAYLRRIPKCTANDCEKSVYNSERLLRECNEIMAKNCACCGEPGTNFILLQCKHYVCKKCGENFRNGKNKYLERKSHTLEVDCKICDEKIEAISLVLQCGHIMQFSSINAKYNYSRPYIISCEECSFSLDDVDLYAALGKEKADKELEKINDFLAKKLQGERKKSEEMPQRTSVNLEHAVTFKVK